MKVSELITLLQAQPQDLQVVYRCCSEQVLLDAEDIDIQEFCLPRADGWVQNNRPDMPLEKYLCFPGN